MARATGCAAMARPWVRSAAYRIGFAWSAAFAAGVAILGVLVFITMHLAFRQQMDSMIGDEADALAAEYRADGPDELRTAIAERETGHSSHKLMYALFDSRGKRLAGHLATTPGPPGVRDVVFRDPVEGPDTARAVFRDLSPELRLIVAADREWLERIDAIVITSFVAAFIVVLMLGAVGGALLGRYLRGRLQAIAGGARKIIAGDTRERVSVSDRQDEFDELSIVLNKMLDRNELLIENLRQVSSDIAHDLRTPLTRLRNYLEARSPTDTFANGAIERVDELLVLFAAILRIAEVESGETRRYFAKVDLSELIVELGETYQPSFSDNGRILLCSAAPNIKLHGDRQLLGQAFANLLDNAIRHTPIGTITRLTLTEHAGMAMVCVTDNGQGIPANERNRVKRRFQRLDISRSTPGFGLGLNLTSAVSALHGGSLILGDAGPGLEARVNLPVAIA
ncbi:HAMP domain-containing sensor histidine kinase [Sphingomonas sp. ASV193]|uniref:sensor histidine kinase n=1 Tax=Sphingomonas sp. ASV193 TaxID=3144405 RepID=UPI0032E8DD92